MLLGGLIGMSISRRIFGGWSDVIFIAIFLFIVITSKLVYDLWKFHK